jgi:DNA polymerase-3 subunit chi
MTEVAFHFNAPDKLNYACRFLRKAFNAGAKVMVYGQSSLLHELDVALWSLGPTDFVAHCLDDAPPHVLSRSPIVLSADVSSISGMPHHDVLLNLGDEIPNGFEKFERVIELVTVNEADRERARTRWKTYASKGYALVRHDLGAKAS